MSASNSHVDTQLMLSRRGPIEVSDERRGRRIAHSDSQRALDFPAHPLIPRAEKSAVSSSVAKTRGEIEAGICAGISRLQQEYLGRGPRDIQAHLMIDLLIVRLFGVLTAAERHLVNALDGEKGRELVKRVRTQLIETARPVMEGIVENQTGVKVISLHHDVSTVTGEEVILFCLESAPGFREVAKKGK